MSDHRVGPIGKAEYREVPSIERMGSRPPHVAIPADEYKRMRGEWSAKAPTEAGYYWWRRLDSKPQQHAQVLYVRFGELGMDLWVGDPVLGYNRRAQDISGEWSGLLVAP